MLKSTLVVLSISLLAFGCKNSPDYPAEIPPSATAAHAQAPVPPPKPVPTKIDWLVDDYAAAVKAAQKLGKPMVVDMWAPWCHTCLSMKHVVLRDPSIAALAERFVWLALDTDKAVNAAALEKLEVRAWPTFFVLGPDANQVQARLVGSATTREFRDFLARGEQGFLAESAKGGSLTEASVLWWFRQGDRATASGDFPTAITAYGRALESPLLADRGPDVLAALIRALYKSEQWDECVRFGVRHLAAAAATRTAKTADFAAYADSCAGHAADESMVSKLRTAIADPEGAVRKVLDDRSAPLSIDDRADGLRIVRSVLDTLSRKDEGTKLAERQRALLDQAVAEATDAHTAMTYNWPLCEVYVRLGRPEALVATLEKSVAALPQEYDPAYRLAWILLKAERPGDALVQAQRAMKLAYGPRKGRVASLVADIQAARGDKAAERVAREQVVAIYEALPAGQARPKAVERAKKSLAEMDATETN